MREKRTVSLCVIAKDEEDLILSCINSVKQLVDEIIVVDTGSSDLTPVQAAGAGARVFHYTWTGDFALARNFSLEKATSDWIIVLDADEALDPVSVEEFTRLLSAPDIDGYFLHVRNNLGAGEEAAWDQVVRLFKNKPDYRFTGAIHEQVAPSILQACGGKGLAVAPLVINHNGYLKTQVIKKEKFNRNTSILHRELKNKPGDPYLLYCLAIEHYQRGEVGRGAGYLEKALIRMQGTEGYFVDVILNIALGLLQLGSLERLVAFSGKALKMLPGQPDLLLLRGTGYLGLGSYQEAVVDLGEMDRLKAGTGRQVSLDYISVTVREMGAYVEIVKKGYDCSHFPAGQRLRALAENLLPLLITEFCPLSAPGSEKNP